MFPVFISLDFVLAMNSGRRRIDANTARTKFPQYIPDQRGVVGEAVPEDRRSVDIAPRLL